MSWVSSPQPKRRRSHHEIWDGLLPPGTPLPLQPMSPGGGRHLRVFYTFTCPGQLPRPAPYKPPSLPPVPPARPAPQQRHVLDWEEAAPGATTDLLGKALPALRQLPRLSAPRGATRVKAPNTKPLGHCCDRPPR